MAHSLSQQQEQQQVQKQKLTTQQMQFMQVLEMPLAQVEQNVMAELNDNPALDIDANADMAEHRLHSASAYDGAQDSDSDFDDEEGSADDEATNEWDFDTNGEREDRQSALQEALENIGFDDRMESDHRVIMENTLGNEETFYRNLVDQIALLDLTDKQQELMEYLIGMLDEDGLLMKSPEIMAEELVLFQGMDVDADEVRTVIDLLKTLDPPGIGAASLQECLLIQVQRRRKSAVTTLMKRILTDHFDQLLHGNMASLYKGIDEDKELVDEAVAEIKRLNPRPGADLGGTVTENAQMIIPDFIVETRENGTLSLSLNYGKIPALAVAEDFDDLVKKYDGLDREAIRKREYEAYVYAKSRVKRANAYITLIELRFRTLYVTMKHIIDHQKRFFLSGDDNELKPMLLKDIAAEMDYDISTISRACNNKYVQTEWGTFPLKHFFAQAYGKADSGDDEYTLQQICTAMRQLIDNEDKKHPLSDEKLTQLLNQKGYALARRTVAKHRERMGIKVARMRKSG